MSPFLLEVVVVPSIFATCSSFFITIVHFFFADNGIYEELFVRAKKHKSCCIMHNLAFTYADLFQQYGCIQY